MITKRLLRFALGPSFLTDDDSYFNDNSDDNKTNTNWTSQPSPHKLRSDALHQAQSHVLNSLGVYAGQVYRSRSSRPENISETEQGPREGELERTRQERDIRQIKNGRYTKLFGTILFLSSALGFVVYDLKVQASTIDQGSLSISEFLKVSLFNRTFPLHFLSSFAVSSMADIIETILQETFEFFGSHFSMSLSGMLILSIIKELLIYPFRELSLAHSLRFVDPHQLIPSFRSISSAEELNKTFGKSGLLSTFKMIQHYINVFTVMYLLPEDIARSSNNSTRRSSSYILEDEQNDDSLDIVDSDSKPVNISVKGIYTFACITISDLISTSCLTLVEPLVFRMMARDYLTSRGLTSPSIYPNFSLNSFRRLGFLLTIEWSIQYLFFELLSATSWGLEYFNYI